MDKSIRNKALVAGVIVAVFMIPIILMSSPTLMFFGGYSGDTIIVDENGNGDYVQLKDALDNANEGDTIRIWDGTYTPPSAFPFPSSPFSIVTDGLELVGNGSSSIIQLVGGTSIIINADEVTIRDLTMGSSSVGILISEGYDNIDIHNISFDSVASGITMGSASPIDWSYNVYITNCTFSSHGVYGIRMWSSVSSIIENCTFTAVGDRSISINYNSSFIDVNNCSFDGSSFGTEIFSSTFVNVTNNQFDGILVDGIYLLQSDFCVIDNNTFIDSARPITILVSDYNIISNNNITGCEWGIYIADADYNVITRNNLSEVSPNPYIYFDSGTDYNRVFLNNILGPAGDYGVDDGGINYWNNTEENGGGNFWFGFTSPNVDSDAFVDIPFLHNGIVDNFAYANPFTGIIVEVVSVDTGYWYYTPADDGDIGDVIDDAIDKPGEPIDEDGGMLVGSSLQATLTAVFIGAEICIVIGAIMIDVVWIPVKELGGE